MINRIWIWGPALAQMAAIFVLSSLTGVPDLPGGLSDYSGHFIGYGILGVFMARGFAGARWAGINASTAWRAIFFSSLYGVTDEFHQSFVPNRSPSVQDWLADTAGAALSVVLVLLAARWRRRRDRRDV